MGSFIILSFVSPDNTETQAFPRKLKKAENNAKIVYVVELDLLVKARLPMKDGGKGRGKTFDI